MRKLIGIHGPGAPLKVFLAERPEFSKESRRVNKRKLEELRRRLDRKGGRGVELADEIDRLDFIHEVGEELRKL